MHRYSILTTLMIWLWIGFFSLSATAQTPPALIKPAPYARLITSIGNYTLGQVNTLYQSKKGYIWIGTNDGLIRFDGVNAKHFVHEDGNPHSLQHNQVVGVIQDVSGNLWVSTYGRGLSVYSPQTGQFKRVDLNVTPQDTTDYESLYMLTIDKHNRLWVPTLNGIRLVDTLSQKAIEGPQWLSKVSKKASPKVYIDQQQHIWIPTTYDGLYWYDNQTLHHLKPDSDIPGALDNKRVREVYQDERGLIWVGTESGLSRFDRNNKTFTRFTPSANSGMKDIDNDIFSIAVDDYGKMWLGTVISVASFDRDQQKFSAVSGISDLNKTFRRNRVNKILRDNDGSLWFATTSGVIYLPKTALQFDYLSNPGGTLKVTDIDLLEAQKMLLSADGKAFDVDLKTITFKRRFEQLDFLYRITPDKNHDLWLSPFGQDLHFYSKDRKNLTPEPLTRFFAEASIKGIYDVIFDDKARMWILLYPNSSSLNGGLALYDPVRQQAIHTLDQSVITDIAQLDADTLALASKPNGLYVVKASDFNNPAAQQNITGAPKSIDILFKDKQNRLWLGSPNEGLAQYHPGDQSFTYYTTKDGLLSNSISNITQDDQQRLWLGSTIGLTRFDPDTKAVMNIEKQDGLLFSAFRKRTAHRRDDGHIIMGTQNGLVIFDPDTLTLSKRPGQVYINDFKLFNRSVKIHSEEQPSVLKQAIEFTKQLTLSYRHSVFSFHFNATEFLRPDKVQFAYRMIGINDDWIYTDASNPVATFTTLSPMDYVFEVKASNSDGSWPTETTQIKVTIEPPLWLTWPAYSAYFIVSLTSLLWYIRRRTQKLQKQAQLLEVKVAQRTEELEYSRDQLAQQSQTVSNLLAQKQQLFANVSHEFRTPLTLILSPVEQLLSRHANEPLCNELNLIKRSGKRLLRMVDQLLEFAKLEQGSGSPPELVSVKQTVELIATSFEPLLNSKQLDLNLVPFDDVSVKVLPDSLNKILINLLSNAVKYTPNDGQIELVVNQHNGRVDISITDTGIGIGQSDQQTIFQRFNRATHDHGESIPGAGIGLALVKELVEANHGQIELGSELGKGTTFIVTLPMADPAEMDQAIKKVPAGFEVSKQQIELEVDNIAAPRVMLPTTANQTNSNSAHKCVLIIDDNADLRTLLHNQLSEYYHCIGAENGQKGLELAKEQLPDLILSDVMMPVMDGYQLAEILKSDPLTHHIPIILLTAKGSVESRIKGLQLLVDDYLAKPFNVEELRLRINNILTIRDILKTRFARAIETSIDGAQKDQLEMTNEEQKFFDRVNAYLGEHFEDPQTSVKSLYSQLHMSEKQLQRKLKAFFNLTFPELMRNYRLNKAIELLQGGLRASSVYHNVGFSSHSYFSQCFKAKFGQAPKAYQQSFEAKARVL